MSLLVAAYPNISAADLEWIQRIRKAHDERYFDVVAPHFTFVFPTSKFSQADFIQHIRQQARGMTPIRFTARATQVVADHSGEFWHTFLVPEEGYDEIINLHDRLYTGILAPELRVDIPFVPHIGVGTGDRDAMEALAQDISEQDMSILGTIDVLSVAEYANDSVVTVREISLA